MDTTKEELKLLESIAAVRMSGYAAGDHIDGVVCRHSSGRSHPIEPRRAAPGSNATSGVEWFKLRRVPGGFAGTC